MRALLVMVAVSGCTYTARQHASRMLLGTAVLSQSCDMGSTYRAASMGWRTNSEGNMLLGPQPSTGTVGAYGAVVIAATVALGLTLPEKLRPIFLGIVTIAGVDKSIHNLATVPGVCGLPAGYAGMQL